MSELNIFEVDKKSESTEITKCVHEMLNNSFAPRVLLFGNPRIGKTVCINKAIYNLQNEFNYILKIDNDFLNNEINFYEKLFYLINKNRFKTFILKTKIKLGINFGLTLEGGMPNLYNYKTVVEKSFINKKTLFHIQIDRSSLDKSEFNSFFLFIFLVSHHLQLYNLSRD